MSPHDFEAEAASIEAAIERAAPYHPDEHYAQGTVDAVLYLTEAVRSLAEAQCATARATLLLARTNAPQPTGGTFRDLTHDEDGT